MNWFEINRKSMELNKKTLLEKFDFRDNLSIELDTELEFIESIETKDGNQSVVIRYHSQDYRLNSSYRPIEEAKRWAEQFEIININTVINMFGLGNGMFARELLNKMGDSDRLLIYEPCFDIFNHVIKNYDISDILSDGRVFLFVDTINSDDFRRFSNALTNISNINSQIQCIYPSYNNIFTEKCIRFFKDLKDSFTSEKINTNTLINFNEVDIINTFKNMEFIKDSSSINELKKVIPTNVPAILIAAGPSVEENIEVIKKAKGRAVIFAADRILDYLLDSGVEPDFVLTIDGKKGVEYFTTKSNVKIPLITYYEANYDILSIHQGIKVFCTNNSFLKRLYNIPGHLPPNVLPSGSVALVGFTACAELGFKRVILVGQDLAYDSENSHAGKIKDKIKENRVVYIEGIDGQQIKSRYDWKEFVLRYEDLMNRYSDIEVIDAKRKGAKIKDAIIMPLEEAVNKYCNEIFDPNGIISNIEKTFSEKDMKKIKEFLQGNLLILRKIKEKANLAIKDCDTLLRESQFHLQTNKYKDAMKRITKTNKYIENAEIYSMMDAYVTAKSTNELLNINKFTNDVDANTKSTFEKSRTLYKNVISAVDYVYPKLEEAIEKI